MPSPVEKIKDESHGLRGKIQETIESEATHLSEDDATLIKFHGSYQQDDRDLRVKRKQEGLDKAWSFMVRTKCPGGDITAEQLQELMAGGLELATLEGSLGGTV